MGKNYMIIESLDQMKEGNNYKSIFVIILEENKKITFGRGQEADIRISDISVSRMHGAISLVNENKIFLQDLGSKFGTLVLLQKRILIGNKKISLQIGRSYIEAKSIPNRMLIEYKDSQKMLELKNH
jgi:pSer/pThr/pTyr-binding forkhead associated (FHA) protein